MAHGFGTIRPFFRERLKDLKFKEWPDGFNFENIPSNILNRAFHIETRSGSPRKPYDPLSLEIEQDVTVRCFFKGFRDPAEAIDKAMEEYGNILGDVLKTEVRTTQVGFRNIYLNNMAIEPLNSTNDNSVILEINFICLIIISV